MTQKKYSTINLFIRSSLFWVFGITTLPVFCLSAVLVSPFMSVDRLHAYIRNYSRAYIGFLKYVCLINYEVEGLENIPKDRNGIVMSKHQSSWETYFLSLHFHSPCFITKRELTWIPFFGWALLVSGPISINRKAGKSAMQQVIEKGTYWLKKGRWIMIFPEGTRVKAGTVGKYKMGGARLAAASGYPIVPVAHNAGRFWPRRGFLKYPGTVKVVIGKPIESEGKTPEELLSLTKSFIETTMLRIDGLVDKSAS